MNAAGLTAQALLYRAMGKTTSGSGRGIGKGKKGAKASKKPQQTTVTGSSDVRVRRADELVCLMECKSRNAAAVSQKGLLCSVFNLLHTGDGSPQKMVYSPQNLAADSVPFPKMPDQAAEKARGRQMDLLARRLQKFSGKTSWSGRDAGELLDILEESASYLPAGVATDAMDVSLFDHARMTAAVAVCLPSDLQEDLSAERLTGEAMFFLCSIDLSGIQDFIYTIVPEHALRTLRARSFYLEIMMEHLIDSLLDKLGLTRANLLYSGGGHSYLLLPGTPETENVLEEYREEVRQWFLNEYETDLYAAFAWTPCSVNDMRDEPAGSYASLFRRVSEQLSSSKSARYRADDIRMLNRKNVGNYVRECKVCKAIGRVGDQGLCETCREIERFSSDILYRDRYAVCRAGGESSGLPLPGGYCLTADPKADVVRYYVKNRFPGSEKMAGQDRIDSRDSIPAGRIWVGDYTTGASMEEMARAAQGIHRIAVLRADVDNLGQAFVSGFRNAAEQNRYATLSRTGVLSRQLSLFFKMFLNDLLRHPEFTLTGEPGKEGRNATIVYSGGDDLFIVGGWDDIVELAVDLHRKLGEFTQGKLTISAGIGIYSDSYPISAMAEEVAALEDKSKGYPGKNAVTLLEDGDTHTVTEGGRLQTVSDGTWSWEELEQEVIGEKFKTILRFFDSSEERGKAMLYNLLDLIRHQDEKINFARYVYLLSRLEPDRNAGRDQQLLYREFSDQMIRWIRSEKDCRQLKTAIALYAYLRREED